MAIPEHHEEVKSYSQFEELIQEVLDGIIYSQRVILRAVRIMLTEQGKIMSLEDDLVTAQGNEGAQVAAIQTAVTDLAARFQAELDALVAAEGNAVTADNVTGAQALVTELQGVADSITAIGAPVVPPVTP